jgi:hypothetical protein
MALAMVLALTFGLPESLLVEGGFEEGGGLEDGNDEGVEAAAAFFGDTLTECEDDTKEGFDEEIAPVFFEIPEGFFKDSILADEDDGNEGFFGLCSFIAFGGDFGGERTMEAAVALLLGAGAVEPAFCC